MENFGGSQDNLQFLGRNPDKEPAIHIGRKDSKTTNSYSQENDSSGVQNLLQHSNTSPGLFLILKCLLIKKYKIIKYCFTF